MRLGGPGRAAYVLLAGLAAAGPAAAERLPLRSFTTADGLAHDHVVCVVPDSRGFLWVCTAQGLSRFDGRRFVTYGAADGLAEIQVNDVVEARGGPYWVATNGAGVYRYDPDAPVAGAAFVRHAVGTSGASNRVNALLEDARGRIWAGSDAGLFRRDGEGGFTWIELPGLGRPGPQVRDFSVDGAGTLWIATSAGVFRAAGERIARAAYDVVPTALLADRGGRLWIGDEHGLAVGGGPGLALPGGDGAAVTAFEERADGRMLIGLRGQGLAEWDGVRLARYDRRHGLGDGVVTALAEDSSGTVWIGSETGGLMRLAPAGLLAFGAADGLGNERAIDFFETRSGELCVIGGMRTFNRREGLRFRAVRPALPGPPSLRREYTGLQARDGGWWIASAAGLARHGRGLRLDDLARVPPRTVYTRRDGLLADGVAFPYEDARGDLWFTYTSVSAVSRWERAAGAFRHYTPADGLPAANRPVAFAEDASGALWVGFREGGLARYRGGRFEMFGPGQGVPALMTRDLHRDARGILWAASVGGGLVRVDDAAGPRPRFTVLTTADGLSSDHVRSLADDRQGRLYVGTSRGIDRLDPASGAVRSYSTEDGLAQNEIQVSYRDREGTLWFGTMRGVSRLVPSAEVRAAPPAVLVGGLAVGGVRRPLPLLGAREVPAFEVGPGGGSVRIEYFAPARDGRGALRFEHRLDGGAWSAPREEDAVEYASLAPGRHHFQARLAGEESPPPASVAFVVLPPLWRRGWFLSLAAAATATVAYRVHRRRLRRQLDLEQVRTRIASDLHDDIGSSLTHVAILSEVAARGLGEGQPETRAMLGRIATASREAVGAMSDVVWAVDPELDRLAGLVHRMRRFASDVFTARDVGLRFEAPAGDLPFDAGLRRDVFLVFKECVNNAARHSGCRAVDVQVRLEEGALVVLVRDDGNGFDPAAAAGGHGLASMHARARRAGGTLTVTPSGGGTSVRLRVPLPGAFRAARRGR